MFSSDEDQPTPPSVAGFITWTPAIFIHLFCTRKYHCFADLIVRYDMYLDYQFLSTSQTCTQDVLTWRKILKINESTVCFTLPNRQLWSSTASSVRTVPYACSSPTLPTLTGRNLHQNLLEVDTIGPCKRSFWGAPLVLPRRPPWCNPRRQGAGTLIGRSKLGVWPWGLPGSKGGRKKWQFFQELFGWLTGWPQNENDGLLMFIVWEKNVGET